MLEISSTQNPKVKRVVKLRNRRDRDQEGVFLIEGYRELLRAVDAGIAVQELFICKELFLGENEDALIQKALSAGAELYHCNKMVFEKLSYRDRPDGLLAVAPQSMKTLSDLELGTPPFLLVGEAIEKPGNLGTMLRSSDAAGVDGLIICDRCTDIHNPNVVRASVGTLFTVPVVEADGKETLEWLRAKGIQILAATPHAEKLYTEVDLTGPVAIAVGTEQLGLSPLWMEAADIQVRIPMRGTADSLNVATATTLLLYEVLRQRENSGC
ncbi:MAG: RNA methyltransferase [Chlamydiia bacterium]|nr:RNA methyltransferase [Chlamydiia bacterium]